jgi:predicted nucleotidyltransferase
LSIVKPSQALALYRSDIRRLVEQSRARNPRIFGSVLHGRDTEDSDLDVLVDPVPGTTLLDLGGLQVKLEELLGVHVDLLTPGDLPKRARERVLGEAVPL